MGRTTDGRQTPKQGRITLLRLLTMTTFLVGLAGISPATGILPAIPLAHAGSGPTPTGLAVSFSVPAGAPCSVSSGTLNSDGTTSAQVTIRGVGQCNVTASQQGNSQYNPATPLTQSFTIHPVTTSITLASIPATDYNDPATLAASVSPTSVNSSLLTGGVTFFIDGTKVNQTPVPIDASGAASITPTVTQAPGPHQVTATFTSSNPDFGDAGTSSATPFTVNPEDTTLTYTGDTTGEYHDPSTLSATLLEDGDATKPLAGKTITFTLGSQTCKQTTDATGTATCSITLNQHPASVSSVSAAFAGDTDYAGSSTGSQAFAATKEQTSLSATVPSLIATGQPVTLSGVLTEDGTSPIAGKSLTFTLGSGSSAQSCTTQTPTTVSGSASCTIQSVNQPTGKVPVTASFAGDADYLPAGDSSKQVLIFAYLAKGAFVLGDATAAAGQSSDSTVTWWGSQWSNQNKLAGGNAPASFKGFAATLSKTPPACGGTWTTSTGNSSGPPSSVPGVMAVVVASKISQSGSTISGNISKIVLVQTNSGYGPDPSQPGTGTIIATLCPATSALLRQMVHVLSHTVTQFVAHAVRSITLRLGATAARHPAQRPGAQGRQRTPRHRATTRHARAGRTASHRLHRVRGWKGLSIFKDKATLLDQEIQFGSIPDHTYGDSAFTITAESVTTSSGSSGGGSSGSIPPDPATIAPPNDPTVASNIFTDTAFLYTGPTPIQTGVAPGSIIPTRVSILRGVVNDGSGKPLSGTTITVLNHPEYGQTISRADGKYDLAVNGGGALTLSYALNGYLPAQRQVTPSWDAYAQVDPVDLVPFDTNANPISFSGSTTSYQVAQGSNQTDTSGSRQETVLVPPGETAAMVLPDGSTQPLTSGTLRLTQYTVGANGLNRMPAALPGTSAYTYAFAVSMDEEEQQGASDVTFSQPLVAYNQNFLGWPVGAIVPIGQYSDNTGQWVAQPNGVVIQILDDNGPNGEADLAVDTGGQAATAAEYQALGITDAERAQLAAMYPVGTSLWRFTFSHDQATFDANGGTAPFSLDSIFSSFTDAVLGIDPATRTPYPRDANGQGTLDLQRQTMSEDRPVSGTPYTLHYSNDRQNGYAGDRSLHIPIPGTGNGDVYEVDVHLQVAGRDIVSVFPSSPGLAGACCATITWDGKDAYGRPVNGVVPATIGLDYLTRTYREDLYTFKGLLIGTRHLAVAGHITGQRHLRGEQTALAPVLGAPVFGLPASGGILARGHVGDITAFRLSYATHIGHFDAKSDGLGGWTLSAHHTYDPTGQLLEMGDGTTVGAQNLTQVIARIAGTGTEGDSGDGGPALQAEIAAGTGTAGRPAVMAAGPDGSIYFANWGPQFETIRKIAPDGVITTVAGGGPGVGDPNGNADPSCATDVLGDGCQATDAVINDAQGMAVGPDGSIYLTERDAGAVRKITPDGIIHLIGGKVDDTSCFGWCGAGYSGDGGPAIGASFASPHGIAVGPDGTVYIADTFNGRIRAIETNGLISTVFHNGVQFSQVATGPDGSVYFNQPFDNIYRIDPSGAVTNVTGGSTGIPAVGNAGVNGLVVDQNGDVFFDSATIETICHNHIFEITPDGIEHPLAGTAGFFGSCPPAGDGGAATQARIVSGAMTVAPDGSIYESDGPTIRKVSAPLPGVGHQGYLIPSPDGAELYSFDAAGKQQQTFDALTGQVLLTFAYDPTSGYLTSITDANGNITTIQHDADGNPTSITAPFGQVTTLTTDTNGYLSSMSDPLHETTGIAMDGGGLLTAITGPDGNTYTQSYDASGYLTGTTDPGTGGWSISGGSGAEIVQAGLQVTRGVTATSADGRKSTLAEQSVGDGTVYDTTTEPDGTVYHSSLDQSLNNVATDSAGNSQTTTFTGDPRFSVVAPLPGAQTLRFPSGLTGTSAATRQVTLADPTNPLSLTSQTTNITMNGQTTTSAYSANGTPGTGGIIATTSPMGRATSIDVDGQGRQTGSQWASLAPTGDQFDSRGRLTSETWGTGNATRTTTYSYGSDGYLTGVTDPLGRTTSYTHDADGRLLSETIPGQGTAHYTYDGDGNVLSFTTPGGKAWNFQYTGVDQIKTVIPPNAGNGDPTLNFTYNADRQITGMTRSDGQNIAYSYDASSGKLTGIAIPQGSYSLSYNASTGQFTGTTAPGNIATGYSYDGALPTGTSWSGPVNGSVSRSYDGSLRPVADTVSGGTTIGYGYDTDNLVTSAGDLVVTRDAATGLVTGTTLGTMTTSRNYNGFGEIASENASASGNQLYSVTYTRDGLGRIASKTEAIDGTSHTYTYTYDPQTGRLTQVQKDNTTAESYSYDADGNRLTGPGVSTPATYDAQGELTQYGNEHYSYDVAGNRASKTDSNGTTSYVYDPLGNLRTVTLPDGTVITYLIDGMNRRVGKEVNGTLVAGYLYDQEGRIVALLDGKSAIRSQFVYAEGSGVPSYLISGGTEYRIISDQSGSPRLVVNAATGQVEEQIDYDSFGNATVTKVDPNWDPSLLPFGFGSGLVDTDTGLVRLGARDYDPRTGSWTARDPLGFFAGDTTSLYGYAYGDPINLTDPSGAGPKVYHTVISAVGVVGSVVTIAAGIAATPACPPCGVALFAYGSYGLISNTANIARAQTGDSQIPTGLASAGVAAVTGTAYQTTDSSGQPTVTTLQQSWPNATNAASLIGGGADLLVSQYAPTGGGVGEANQLYTFGLGAEASSAVGQVGNAASAFDLTQTAVGYGMSPDPTNPSGVIP